MDKLCIDSSGCKYIKKGSIYACKTDGRYTVINGRKYLTKRFTERIHEPTPRIVYGDLLIPVAYDDLNKLNNAVNAERGIKTYDETTYIQTHSIKPQVRELRQSIDKPVRNRKSDNILVSFLRKLVSKGGN